MWRALPSALQGNFNKMAFIKKMLAITPRADAEWIWWTDADTLITDTPYEFPFHR
jgi:galactosyl transferase GMA12/MNN10 family